MSKIHSIRRRSVTVLFATAVCCVVAAVGPSSGGARSLTSYCTQYAPSLEPLNTCGIYGTMAGTGYYQTPSTGLRTNNQILTYANRGLKLWYPSTSQSATGNGTYLELGGSGTTYVYADCQITSGGSVTGYCMTVWHS